MQNKVYEILKNSQDYVSGQDISKALNVSRQAVWKSINSLKEQGFVIDSITNKGYKIIENPKNICKQIIEDTLETEFTGKNLEVLETATSTNDVLKEKGRLGCPNGTVVIAREQTAGKGRLGRGWISKKDENIMFSVLYRPQLTPMDVSGITPIAGLAVCKALRDFCKIDCKIKWPNDIIVKNKKLVGILTEMSAEFDGVQYIVIGIGINTDQKNFPDEVRKKATSIFMESNNHIDKNAFLVYLLKCLEDEFTKSDYRLNETNVKQYKSLCATIGRNVTFFRGNHSFEGVAENINENGELLVRLDNNKLECVNSGEVTIQGIY